MGIIKYDMRKLAKFDRFDLVNAARNFDNRQIFFDKLTEVAAKASSYLQSYNPDVVIYGEDIRKEFFTEFTSVRDLMRLLCMTAPIEELFKNIENTVNQKRPGLSDLLLQFNAEMRILVDIINTAHMSVEEKPMVLAVDDNPEILTVINEVLKEKYKVVAMTDGELAMKAVDMYLPALFLLDIEMPTVSGYELVKKIKGREDFKNTPVLFLTSQGGRESVLTAKECGADDYILKPVNRKVLLDKVEWHLALATRKQSLTNAFSGYLKGGNK